MIVVIAEAFIIVILISLYNALYFWAISNQTYTLSLLLSKFKSGT